MKNHPRRYDYDNRLLFLVILLASLATLISLLFYTLNEALIIGLIAALFVLTMTVFDVLLIT